MPNNLIKIIFQTYAKDNMDQFFAQSDNSNLFIMIHQYMYNLEMN